MPSTAHRVAIADDDVFVQSQLEGILSPDYAVSVFGGGRDLLAAVAEDAPDLILLDLEMADVDGLAVCNALKSDDATAEIPVVFVSGHDEPAARLAAYQAGADDYLVKPVSDDDLRAKVRVVIRQLENRRALASQSSQAQQMAFAVLTSMGELGAVMNFMRASFTAHTPADLLATIASYYAESGLSGGARLYSDRGAESILIGDAAPLTDSALGGLHHLGRISEYRNRLAINYPRCSLLVSNLPLSDPDRCGRIRDNFALVAEAAEIRLAAIDDARRLHDIGDEVRDTVALAERTAQRYMDEARQYRQQVTVLLDGQFTSLERAFVHLGLTESQESTLLDIAKSTGEHVLDAAAPLQDFEQDFHRVIQRLARIHAQAARGVTS